MSHADSFFYQQWTANELFRNAIKAFGQILVDGSQSRQI